MYNDKFLNAGEYQEIEDKKVIDLLLSQPGVEEYVDKKQAKALEAENAKLKEELEEIKKETKKDTKAKAKAKK
jgi:hypothetical protein